MLGGMTDLAEIAPGVLVATSEFAMTTTTVVAGSDGGCLLIDPGVYVAEMAALAEALARRGLRPAACWSTHPHWDHVLWHRALGEGVPRWAAPAAVPVLQAERAGLLAQLAASAPGHDESLIEAVRALDATAIPWDGPAAELVVHNGHAPGHGAVFLPGCGVLVAGDMCSDIEIPLLDWTEPDAVGDYRAGLHALGMLPAVLVVVPGHGHVGDGEEFLRRLAADAAYLDKLRRRDPFDDRRITSDWLRKSHEKHLAYVRERWP
jgi:hydroxyacylglutathione hydrolase